MKINVKEATLFAMLGALMYASKFIMEVLPNIHLIGVLIVALTLTYRKKALYPIYIFVLLNGLLTGFSTWWVPYLYVWVILWGVVMLLPEGIPKKIKPVLYASICALHGFLFGILYAPFQAIVFGLSFKGMISWIIAGLPYDAIHGVSNFISGLLLIVPLTLLFKTAEKAARK